MMRLKRRRPVVPAITLLVLLGAGGAFAHSVQYAVQQKGYAVRTFYTEKDPAAYSRYELYGPGDKEPHQIGQTDRNGYVGFVPDRPGIWTLRIWGESGHGFHGVSTEIRVGDDLNLEGFSKPLLATHTKFITGIGIILGIFGVYALWASRRGGTGEGSKS